MAKGSRAITQRSNGGAVQQQTVVAASFSGPLPPPSILAEYEALVPGSAKSLVEAGISSSNTRTEAVRAETEMRRKVVDHTISDQRFGRRAVAGIVAMCILGGFWCIVVGAYAAGAAILCTVMTAAAVPALLKRRETTKQADD